MISINNRVLKALKLIALKNVQSYTIEQYIERAMRYYSKTYATPLHEVRNLNPIEVLIIYMEDEMLNMTPEELSQLKKALIEEKKPLLDTESKQEIDKTTQEMSDEEWLMREAMAAAQQERAKQAAQKASSILSPESQKKLQDSISKIEEAVRRIKGIEETKNMEESKDNLSFEGIDDAENTPET